MPKRSLNFSTAMDYYSCSEKPLAAWPFQWKRNCGRVAPPARSGFAMANDVPNNLAEMLAQARAGDQAAADRLFPVLYEELRVVARRLLSRENAGHTLQTTALVHEVYIRLIGSENAQWRDNGHFLATASQAMRRILVDHARARNADKRGGEWGRVELAEEILPSDGQNGGILALNEALDRLAVELPIHARIVEMRFFGGLNSQEIAAALGDSDRTVRRHLAFAKVWLQRTMRAENSENSSASN